VTYSFRWHYGPGVDSTSSRNEYQVYFLGGKGGRCVRLTTLPPSFAVVMKSGNLNFLEPPGPLQASNGTGLPFYISLPNLIEFGIYIIKVMKMSSRGLRKIVPLHLIIYPGVKIYFSPHFHILG